MFQISESPIKKEIKTTTTSRTQRIIKTAQDEFDTGSDSESDIVTNNYSTTQRGTATSSLYDRHSPIKSSLSSSYISDASKFSPKPLESSYSSAKNVSFNSNTSPGRMSYNSPSLASEYATDRLNQIRSRLSLNNSGKYILS